jgi:Cu(I)/Ag(I) efflux system membrane fusion protein
VVTHGNFKLDGAAQLADKLSMMNRAPGTGANKTGHEGHTIGAEDSGDINVETVSSEFKSQLNEVLKEYLVLKDALVESDNSSVSLVAKNIQSKLDDVDMSLVKGDMHVIWMDHLAELSKSVKELTENNNLEYQRDEFLTLSETLIESIKTFGVTGVVYQQFCPMTNGGKGGYWLSESEEIANPYYGDQMHNCGEIVTKIES